MEASAMLRCFFVATILHLWEEGKIPSIPKIKVTVNYTNRNILPFFIDFLSLSLQPYQKLMSIMQEWSGKKKKMEKQIVLPVLLQEVENFSQL